MNAYQVPADPTAVMGRRFGAFFIDLAIYLAIAFAVSAAFGGLKSEEIPDGISNSEACDIINEVRPDTSSCFAVGGTAFYSDANQGATTGIPLLALIGNHVVLAGLAGGSLGKLAVGIRIVKKDSGQIAGIGSNIVRFLLWIVDYLPCFIPGLITALATKGHRRVGDMAAGTLVVGKDSVGRPPMVPGLSAPAMAGGYPPPPAGGGWSPPAPSWDAPPAPPPADPWNPPPASPAPDPWGAPAPTPSTAPSPDAWGAPTPPAPPSDAWGAPAPAAPAPDPWGAPAATPSPAPSWSAPEPTQAYPAADPAPAPAWEPRTPDPEPEPTTWQSPVAREAQAADATLLSPTPAEPEAAAPAAPAWEPEPAPAPEPEPTPEPGPAPAATTAASQPGVDAPMWDAARNAYIQWDPSVGSWMQWDDASGQWRPIS